jgi:hypothetical protein
LIVRQDGEWQLRQAYRQGHYSDIGTTPSVTNITLQISESGLDTNQNE